ncbi:MAG: SGNH/GDSL hydrolase family protein [Bacteroidota bacterium]|nr:SGNH/GDSL hydrolase family protein [Bacteroidota bacterium]
MMRLFIALFLIISFYSCSKKVSPSVSLPPAVSSADTLKTYLALGDSYTIGQSVAINERFPAQTVALLRQQGIKIADPVYIAQTGWTTANLQNAINNQNPANNFDVVSLLIGVNDQYQRMDTAGYAIRFAQLLEKAIQLAGGKKERVFVLSIPDYSVTPFVPADDKQRVAMEIDWFNEINFFITSSYGVSYTNITTSTRQAATNASLIANDNLHPSGLEYKKWAEMLAPKMKAVLQ